MIINQTDRVLLVNQRLPNKDEDDTVTVKFYQILKEHNTSGTIPNFL